MPDEGTMNERGRPYQKHSGTSRGAAHSISDEDLNRYEAMVFDHICSSGGATDEQIGEATGLGGNTVRPRRVRLVELRKVVDSGRVRRTKKGRSAVVWEKTPDGYQPEPDETPEQPTAMELEEAVKWMRQKHQEALDNGEEVPKSITKLGRWLRYKINKARK